MEEEDFAALSIEIQRAFDEKDLATAIGYYHPDVVYIGPSFAEPFRGIEALKKALEAHFKGPQRTKAILKQITTRQLSDNVFVVNCLVEGYQMVYYSRYDVRGWLSRVFVETDQGFKVIHEHFSLIK